MKLKKKIKIGFYGLSHLGLCYLVATAEKKYSVVGCDKQEIIKNIKKNNYLKEPKVFEYYKKNEKRIKLTENINHLNECEIIYFSFDTPIKLNGHPDISFINQQLRFLLNKIDLNKKIIILSQVYPGFTEKIKWNKDRLFYQVETLIFGNAFERALNPERIIVGLNKDKNISKISSFLNCFSSKIIKCNYQTAELTKISINIFLISSINTTNLITEISKKLNADWNKISESLKLDKRIGKHAYLTPSIGLSGSNLLRDLNVVKSILNKNQLLNKSELVNFWHKQALDQNWTINEFKKIILKKQKYNCLVLGLAYKKDTNSTINSASISFLKKISKFQNCKFFAYDPVVKSAKIKSVAVLKNINDFKFNKNKKVLIVMTPWDQFNAIKKNYLSKFDFILDPYNFFFKKRNSKNKYISLY